MKLYCSFLRHTMIILGCWLTLNFPSVWATEAAMDELTTAYIFQLSRLVEWPVDKINVERFTICTFPENDLGDKLFELERNAVHGKAIKVKEVNLLQGLPECHVIFLDNLATSEHNMKVINIAQLNHVLTMSKQIDFVNQGGMIQLFEKNGHLNFEVNYIQTQNALLSMSSKLLRLATKVIK